jgi:hypothetical protein
VVRTRCPVEVVLEALNIILAQVVAALHLDEDKRAEALVLDAVDHVTTDVDRASRSHRAKLSPTGHEPPALDNRPMLRPPPMPLQAEPLAGVHLDELDLIPGGVFQDPVESPWPLAFSLRLTQDLLVDIHVLVDHAGSREMVLDVFPTGRPLQLRQLQHRGDRLFDRIHQEAGFAVGYDLGHAPLLESDDGGAAGHGFHHGQPKRFGETDGVEQRIGVAQKLVAFGGADAAYICHVRSVQERLDLLPIVILILDYPRHHEAPARASRNLDGFGGSLVFVNASEEQEVVARFLSVGERTKIDAVIGGRDVAQFAGAVGVADGDVVRISVVLPIDRKYPARGEAVNRGHHRRRGEP